MQYPSKQDVEQVLEPLYSPIHSSFHSAFQQLKQATVDSWAIFTTRSRASSFRDYLVHDLTDAFEQYDNIHRIEQRGMVLWVIEEKVALRIKKLDDNLVSSNHYTQQSLDFVNQQLLLPGIDEIIALNMGYVPNEIWTKIDGIYITCPLGTRKVLWAIDINDKIDSTQTTTALYVDDEDEEERRVRVRVKNQELFEGGYHNEAGGDN